MGTSLPGTATKISMSKGRDARILNSKPLNPFVTASNCPRRPSSLLGRASSRFHFQPSNLIHSHHADLSQGIPEAAPSRGQIPHHSSQRRLPGRRISADSRRRAILSLLEHTLAHARGRHDPGTLFRSYSLLIISDETMIEKSIFSAEETGLARNTVINQATSKPPPRPTKDTQEQTLPSTSTRDKYGVI